MPPPSETISIRPKVSILSVLSHLNYDPWYALGEFVDNSIQSYRNYDEELNRTEEDDYTLNVSIDIERDSERITVRDNAAGIHKEDYARAFRPAELPPDTSGLSEFGMGMKSAACWFSPSWYVRTSALGEPTEKTISFEVDEIVEEGVEELKVESREAARSTHFTEIVLTDLHRLPQYRTLHKVKQHLTDIYRHFTREGLLRLTLNGEDLEYELPDILEAPYYKGDDEDEKRWIKEISFDFGGGLRVEGFAAIRKTGSTSEAGFSLFRRGRVIEGSGDQKYRPKDIFGNTNSFKYQRIFGELHLSGFDVSHTKDGFQWDENEQPFLDLLREEFDSEPLPLLDQAEGYRKNTRDTGELREGAEEATDSTAQSVEEEASDAIEQVEERGVREDEKDSLPSTEIAAQRVVEIDYKGQTWEITIELSNDEAVGSWLEFCDGIVERDDQPTRKIGIRLSLAHPFMKRYGGKRKKEIEPLLRLAVALALAERTAKMGGVTQASAVRCNVNDILRNSLHKPS
jgi:hypothetical protein